MNKPEQRVRIVQAGKAAPGGAAIAIPPFPDDVAIGEIIQMPNLGGGLDLFILIDSTRSFDNGVWVRYVTISIVSQNDVDDTNIAKTRRELLKLRGWLG